MTDKKYKYWLAVVDGQLVQFSELAHMMAKALHPSDSEQYAYAAARINLEAELKLAVRDGLLRVRNRSGLGLHTFPHGDALQRAVLIPDTDLEPFLNERGIELRITPYGNGPDYWTLENAAAAMQEQLNWHDGTRAEFQDELQDAAQSGALVVLNPRTCLPYIPETVRTYWEYVTPDSVNKWLAALNAPYRWNLASVANKPPNVAFSAPPSLSRVDANGNAVFDSEGYAQYLTAKSARNAQGRYTIAEAAQVLANAHGLEPAAFIESRMLPAIAANSLQVIDPADGGPLRGRKCNVYADEVTPAGIDAWLSAEGFAKHVRWPEPATTPEPPAPIAEEQKEVTAKAAPTGPRLSINKAALIAQHKHEWPTIEGDIKGASENGLSKVAKAGARDWYEDDAMQWARSRNKLIKPASTATLTSVMSSLPSKKHRLEG